MAFRRIQVLFNFTFKKSAEWYGMQSWMPPDDMLLS